MDGYTLYKYIEFAIFILYLFYIYLLIQIWFLWKDIDEKEINLKPLLTGTFFKRNFIYVLLISFFLMIHEFLEGITIPDAHIYFEFFEMLALIALVSLIFEWYRVLRTWAPKKSLLIEFTEKAN